MTSILRFILVVSILGAALSGYTYYETNIHEGPSVCTIGETFDCDVVNQSKYAKIGNFPVSILGVIGYLMLALGAFLKLKKPMDKGLSLYLVIGAFGGFVFSLYLTSIEAFVLNAYCLLCLLSQTFMLLIFIAVINLLVKEYKQRV